MKLFYILEADLEELLTENPTDIVELKAKRHKRKEDDFICSKHILHALSTSVYNAHRNLETTTTLWTVLENKYCISKKSNKKFLISDFMDFKMTDNKMIIEQVNKILLIVNHLKDANIELSESFVFVVIMS